ncbi:MAG: 5'/3'-nucleotidase SurE, partial [Anaerolineae bacterium]|nr:5'/3'-nucleotidase SurE [Anaerolineae bacterium]
MPTILITNDDGAHSPGLLALKQALDAVGDVIVFAPDHNWSGAGHTKTLHKPLRVDKVTLADGSPAYITSGAPSDCVALALLGVAPRRPDVVVSGINLGPNLGEDITYSGTVAGAMEAVVFGIPGISVSQDMQMKDGGPVDFKPVARFAARLAAQVLERGLPPKVFLNVNGPALPASQVRGVQVTRLGRRIYRDALVERTDPRGKPYYWIGGDVPSVEVDEGTDGGALAEGYISVTPLNMDMTDRAFMARL